MWFGVICTLIDNEYASSQWSKCCRLTISNNERKLRQDLFTIENSDMHTLHNANALFVRGRPAFQKFYLFPEFDPFRLRNHFDNIMTQFIINTRTDA